MANKPRNDDCLALALEEAERIINLRDARSLTQEELNHYRDCGYLIVRGLLPESLACILRDRIIHPGLRHAGLDVNDPTTWGKGGLASGSLSWFERLASSMGSETPYYGRWCGFGRGLESQYRTDVTAEELENLKTAFSLATKIAALRMRVILDQLAGPGEWDDTALVTWTDRPDEGLPKSLHVRYGLSTKDPRYGPHDHKWPLLGWHIDGAWHDHKLGQKQEQRGQQHVRPDHVCVGMLVYSDVLPKGGLTGVLPGSHVQNMRTVLRYTACGGIPNARLLVNQSLFGSVAVDPVATIESPLCPGDALLMHPYLSHSSAWNFQTGLRLGARLQFDYKTPHNAQTLLEMVDRQRTGINIARGGGFIPPNSQLYSQTLESEPWKTDDWDTTYGRVKAFIERRIGLRR